ncbi:MAG: tRNA (adenosine(37)-N6)-dimethylallyltransferase MiaA [Muribaculaceae bacterium]|nr:tRNA (adenosine(37)-N6)-dimethylallyltransferase MiaA [Muribaculaceae bacterium]
MNTNLSKPKVIAIVGATASGKTAYSIELAKKIDGEIISADSRLVYKGFDIGTAKPTAAEQSEITHYLIDIVEPEFEYSAGLYKQQAKEAINKILAKSKTPIIVGGTGLYIDILLKNYDLPQIEADRELRDKLNKLETFELYSTLQKLDSVGSEAIDQNDRKKIIRAIEIIKKTGKSLNEVRGIGESEYQIEWIGRNFDRKTLYDRIDKRVEIMIETGLVEETKKLLDAHGRIPNLINTIGYREILGYIDNRYSLEEAKELLKKNTRNYAKRQLTWFRRNEEINWNIYPEKMKK